MSYKRWLIIAAFLFGIGIGSGLLLALATPTSNTGLLAEDIAALEQLAGLLASLPPWSIFVFIFIKNVSAILISFALSPIFCLVPAMALIINGGLLGWLSVLVIQEKSLGYLLASILPHGIFELPAFIMAEAVAFSFGTAAILAMFKKERRELLLPNFRQNLRYLTIAVILLLPAAIIETYLTPLLLK